MSEKSLEALRKAGTPVDLLSPGEREVFASLSEQEVAALSSIQARLNAAAGEVEGQAEPNNNNVVC